MNDLNTPPQRREEDHPEDEWDDGLGPIRVAVWMAISVVIGIALSMAVIQWGVK